MISWVKHFLFVFTAVIHVQDEAAADWQLLFTLEEEIEMFSVDLGVTD